MQAVGKIKDGFHIGCTQGASNVRFRNKKKLCGFFAVFESAQFVCGIDRLCKRCFCLTGTDIDDGRGGCLLFSALRLLKTDADYVFPALIKKKEKQPCLFPVPERLWPIRFFP